MPNLRLGFKKRVEMARIKINRRLKSLGCKNSSSVDHECEEKKELYRLKNIRDLLFLRLISNGYLRTLSASQIRNLNHDHIFQLVSGRYHYGVKYLSVQEAANLNSRQINILLDKNFIKRYKKDHTCSSLLQFLKDNDNINYSESTHASSIHRSVSDSVSRLYERYKFKMHNINLDNYLSKIRHELKSLYKGSKKDNSLQSLKHKIALKCFDRVSAANYTFIDQSTGVSFRQLLVLYFIAINDSELLTGSYKDAMQQLIDGLFEMQVGDNINIFEDMQNQFYPRFSGSSGEIFSTEDLESLGNAVCITGAFNKLIEKLQGLHPDCHIEFVTTSTASFKLSVVVKEELESYLDRLFCINTRKEFTKLLVSIEVKGVDFVWDNIRNSISDKMFSEFGSLYSSKSDKTFTDLIDCGVYADIDSVINKFKDKLNNPNQEKSNSVNLKKNSVAFKDVSKQLCASVYGSRLGL